MRISDWSSDVCSSDLRVLIIGGYGNFGSYIARSLADDPAILLLIGGRSSEKALRFAASLDAVNRAEGHSIDIDGDVSAALAAVQPDIVIHTTGPFQRQDYAVSEACIASGFHYRSEERRVGKKGVVTCSCRWTPDQ